MGPSLRNAASSLTHRFSIGWLHWAVVAVAFGVTGFLSLLFSRSLLNGVLGIEGSLWSGPWSYRIVYLVLIPPFYSATLVAVGTLLGKHTYFRRRVARTWGRLLPIGRQGRDTSKG